MIDVRLDLGLDRRAERTAGISRRLYDSLGLDRPGRRRRRRPTALVDRAMFDLAEPRVRDRVRHVRARERAAGPRRNQLRDVGAPQRPLPAPEGGAGRRHVDGAAALPVAAHHRRRAPLSGHHRRDDGARRRVAVSCRSADFSSAPTATAALLDLHFRDDATRRRRPAPRSRVRARRMGWGFCGRARRSRRTAASTRPICAPDRIAEFLLLNSEFPRSVRFAAAQRRVVAARGRASARPRGLGGRAERLAGRLHASLDYGQVDEILSDNPHAYLEGIGAPVRADSQRDPSDLHRVPDRNGDSCMSMRCDAGASLRGREVRSAC